MPLRSLSDLAGAQHRSCCLALAEQLSHPFYAPVIWVCCTGFLLPLQLLSRRNRIFVITLQIAFREKAIVRLAQDAVRELANLMAFSSRAFPGDPSAPCVLANPFVLIPFGDNPLRRSPDGGVASV